MGVDFCKLFDDNVLRFFGAEGDVGVLDDVFGGIGEGGEFYFLDGLSFDEAHFHKSFFERTLAQYFDDASRLAGEQVGEFCGVIHDFIF